MRSDGHLVHPARQLVYENLTSESCSFWRVLRSRSGGRVVGAGTSVGTGVDTAVGVDVSAARGWFVFLFFFFLMVGMKEFKIRSWVNTKICEELLKLLKTFPEYEELKKH